MNKFDKAVIIDSVDEYKEIWKARLEKEIDQFLVNENAPVYTFFRRLIKKPILTREDAITNCSSYGEFMQYYSIIRLQQQLCDANLFLEYVRSSEDLDYVYLTEKQFYTWG